DDRRALPQGTRSTHATEPESGADTAAAALVHAFYSGLGADDTAVTATLHRRDLAIARQLVSAGATMDEAEQYARDVSQTAGRIAPVDLRSFERERLGWLARRRGQEQTSRARCIDRTGKPPSWQTSLFTGTQHPVPPGQPQSATAAGANVQCGLPVP